MFRYFARLYELHGLPVYPVAVFSFSEPLRPEPHQLAVTFPDFEVLRFQFRAIQLNRLPWRDYISRPNPLAAALMSRMRIAPHERAKVKAQCLRLLATLKLTPARMKLISGFVDTYLKLNAEEETLFRKELGTFEVEERKSVMEIVTSWMEQGIEKGIEQGRQSEAALVLRLIRKKLGPVPPETEAAIRDLPLASLEELGEALLDFAAPADLEAWLSRSRDQI